MADAEVYDTVYCSSDWHNPPDKLKESVVAFLEQAKRGQAEAEKEGRRLLVIGVGDLFDLMMHGWEAFISGQAIQQFAEELGDLEFVYVAGNHDPLPWIDEILKRRVQRLKPVPHYGVNLDGQQYYFAHGDRWDLKGRWLHRLNPLLIRLCPWAPVHRIVQWWMARVNPGGLKRRIKQLESEREGELKGSDERGRTNRRLERERQRYNEATGWVHGGAGRHAETNECLVICGHTHKPWRADAFEGEKPVQRVHDDGDLVDSCTYLVIEGGTATLQRLEGNCKPERSKPESSLDQVTRWALLAGLASALMGLVIALLPIPISVSTLLGRYPWLPGWIVWQATTFLAAGVALFAVGCVLDMVARRLGPSD